MNRNCSLVHPFPNPYRVNTLQGYRLFREVRKGKGETGTLIMLWRSVRGMCIGPVNMCKVRCHQADEYDENENRYASWDMDMQD